MALSPQRTLRAQSWFIHQRDTTKCPIGRWQQVRREESQSPSKRQSPSRVSRDRPYALLRLRQWGRRSRVIPRQLEARAPAAIPPKTVATLDYEELEQVRVPLTRASLKQLPWRSWRRSPRA